MLSSVITIIDRFSNFAWGVGVQKNSGVKSERGVRSVLSKMQQSLRVQSLVGTELG